MLKWSEFAIKCRLPHQNRPTGSPRIGFLLLNLPAAFITAMRWRFSLAEHYLYLQIAEGDNWAFLILATNSDIICQTIESSISIESSLCVEYGYEQGKTFN